MRSYSKYVIIKQNIAWPTNNKIRVDLKIKVREHGMDIKWKRIALFAYMDSLQFSLCKI